MRKIKVFIVEDHSLFIQGLSLLMAREKKFKLVGVSEDGVHLLGKISRLKPDVILMDVMLPGVSGIDLVKSIRRRYKKIKIIIVSAYFDDYHKLKAFFAGASDYLPKTSNFDDLSRTITQAFIGEQNVFLKTISARVKNNPSSIENVGVHSLTPLEVEILNSVKHGHGLQMVADSFSCSLKTLEFHLGSIYSKLDACNRTQAVYYALKNHVISV